MGRGGQVALNLYGVTVSEAGFEEIMGRQRVRSAAAGPPGCWR